MKKISLSIALILAVMCTFAQSKQELKLMISSLENRLEVLNSKFESLERTVNSQNLEILTLKSKLAETQSSVLNRAGEVGEKAEVVPESQTTSERKRCKAITASGTQCSRDAQEGSDYCWQHAKTYDPKSTSTKSSVKSSSGSSTGSGRTIYTGPRGGKYYINGSGKKVYIKK
jgi:colicin import membrane protein